MSGTPVFAGTRVPVQSLWDHLEAADRPRRCLSCRRATRRPCAFCSMSRSRVSLHGSWKAMSCRPFHGGAGQASARLEG